MTKSILFYINPFSVRNDIVFYAGAMKNKILRQAKLLQSEGWNVSIMASSSYSDFDGLSDIDFIGIEQIDLIESTGSAKNVEMQLYVEGNSLGLAKLISSKLDSDYDLICAWETPADFFAAIQPKAKVVSQMPGFVSRLPYPELYVFDVAGLFFKSTLYKNAETIKSFKATTEAMAIINFCRSDLHTSIESMSPFTKTMIADRTEFSRLVLLPLQVTEQYAYKVNSGYSTQMEMLLDVLAHTPEHVGVVVTQYVTEHTNDRVLNKNTASSLKKTYPNLIYKEEFDAIDNVSQYLLPIVDGVITFSSSIGYQAMLWNKPLIVLEGSHLAPFADYRDINEFAHQNNPSVNLGKNNSVLAWMLEHQQVLARSVLNDAKLCDALYTNLITEQYESNSQLFASIGRSMSREFIKFSNVDRAAEKLGGASGVSKLETQMTRIVKENNVELVTFDIFDTLVDRSVEQPVHVFTLIEEKVREVTNKKINKFTSARQHAERSLRNELLESADSNVQEIQFSNIYQRLADTFELTEEEKNAVMDLELEQEYKVLKQRKSGVKLFRKAKQMGVKVAYVSDMYLPRNVIEKILTRCEYPLEDTELYLSSDVELRKHEGDLYDYVMIEEEVEPVNWLHIGDNPHGDIRMAKERGINTLKITSAFRLIRENKKLSGLLEMTQRKRTMGESVVLGLAQKRFFDSPELRPSNITHFGGDAYAFGYYGAGVMFLGFVNWIIKKAREDGTDKLLFLSRDGKVLYQMAKELYPDCEIGFEYAYSSRRSARVASLVNKGDISELVDSAMQVTTLESFFLKKFGIALDDSMIGKVVECGFENNNDKIHPRDREKVRLLALKLSEVILSNAKEERRLLTEYYRKKGVNGEQKIGVVDIGYAGTMQVALQKMMVVDDIRGYYYMTFSSALENEPKTGMMRGYAGEFIAPEHSSNILCKNGFFYETVFCSNDSSFICFKGSEKGPIAKFDINKNDLKRQELIENVHKGAVHLAREMKNVFEEHLPKLQMDAYTSSLFVNDMIAHPSGADAGIFEGVVFDDSFAGASLRFVVPPRDKINENLALSLRHSIWKEGASVFARRPDINPGDKNKKNQVKAEEKLAIVKKTESSSKPIQKRPVESWLINKLVKDERKKQKYKTNRDNFFLDSKSNFANLYWKVARQPPT